MIYSYAEREMPGCLQFFLGTGVFLVVAGGGYLVAGCLLAAPRVLAKTIFGAGMKPAGLRRWTTRLRLAEFAVLIAVPIVTGLLSPSFGEKALQAGLGAGFMVALSDWFVFETLPGALGISLFTSRPRFLLRETLRLYQYTPLWSVSVGLLVCLVVSAHLVGLFVLALCAIVSVGEGIRRDELALDPEERLRWEKGLLDKRQKVRIASVVAMEEIGDVAAVRGLTRVLTDRRPVLAEHWMAVRALRRLGTVEATDSLLRCYARAKQQSLDKLETELHESLVSIAQIAPERFHAALDSPVLRQAATKVLTDAGVPVPGAESS